ncbi:tRNA (adenosine(37)-N6)-dimethylallyltransferase MiaA [Oceanobacillus halotolerans]|uniref:tRNA (adenosine(37)-N6)-dimethylallyltransferase MiaA n=1 Tax=Oceanobacillus halotolerans TaxID=2663380 RepID=UPI0013DCA948|nr:tRNA (adenosine(37)-N6)-dimethylallyltransferase MiaA [Oceanobacillus halotolerans]
MKKTIIAIVGPTAVGKTKLSIEIAKQFNGEIISGDSMQVYRGMDIGTAKIKEHEKQGIPHYLIDSLDPHESFSVADFQSSVNDHIEEITSRNKLPIIVGGSGLYIQAALFDYNFADEKRDPTITKKFESIIAKQGIKPLYEQLKRVDPEEASKIHPNNHRRVVRALEIVETTGKTKSQLQEEQNQSSPYNVILIGLEMDRQLLYERINLRIDQMVADGLVEEVRTLYKQGLQNAQSMKAIGYKEFIPFFKGEQELEHCIDILKRNSRRYAKRQYTWFKNKMDITWYTVEPNTINEKFGIILRDLAGILKDK